MHKWWPANSAFEVFVGAILTQQSNWKNVEIAISNLKRDKLLDMNSICNSDILQLERSIKPCGFYRQKARRLKSICSNIESEFGSFEGLLEYKTEKIREILLQYTGIGPETADCIVLFGFSRPSFVIDAYTKRIMSRLDSSFSKNGYYDLKSYFESGLPNNPIIYMQMHAYIVELAKKNCKIKPKCDGCPLNVICEHYLFSQIK